MKPAGFAGTGPALAGKTCSHPSHQVSLNCTGHLKCSELASWPLFFLSLCLSLFFFFYFFLQCRCHRNGKMSLNKCYGACGSLAASFFIFPVKAPSKLSPCKLRVCLRNLSSRCLVGSVGTWHFGALGTEDCRATFGGISHAFRLLPSPPSAPPFTPHPSTPLTPAFAQGRPLTPTPPAMFPSFQEAL